MPDRCECCDLPVEQCGREAEKRRAPMGLVPTERSRVFTASYYGTCMAFCGERIEPGDNVCYVDDALVHEECV